MTTRFSIAVVALAAMALLAFAGTAGAQVTGSKHDLNQYAAAFTGAGAALPAGFYACQACHSPHRFTTNPPITGAPLANREFTPGAYTVYSSSTLDGAIANPPTGVDLVCLSCHDGTAALDIFGQNTAGAGGSTRAGSLLITGALGGPSTGNGLVGTNLVTTHPVSVVYGADANLEVTPLNNIPLYGNEVKCASCHNVHDNTTSPFLRITASSLCTSCHTQ